jgi:hypothetical protein
VEHVVSRIHAAAREYQVSAQLLLETPELRAGGEALYRIRNLESGESGFLAQGTTTLRRSPRGPPNRSVAPETGPS